MKTNDEKLLAALLKEKSVPAAAALAGVAESTLYRRLADDSFRAEYERRQRATLDAVCNALQEAMSEAVEALIAVMRSDSAPSASRVSAARCVLDYGVKLTELTDLLERVEALEAKEAMQ